MESILNNKLFFILMIISKIVLSQNISVIDSISESTFDYISDDYYEPNSFTITDSSIYIGTIDNTFYLKINDPSYDVKRIDLRGEDIRQDGYLLVNVYLDVYNLKNDEIFKFFDFSSVKRYTEAINFYLKDSLVFIFQQGENNLHDYYGFKIYDLRTKKYIDSNLTNVLREFKKTFTDVVSIYIKDQFLYLMSLTSVHAPYMINKIDYMQDKIVNRLSSEYIYDIIGEDIFGNIILYDNFKLKNNLCFISTDLKEIFNINMAKLINKLSFMKNNNYFEDRTGIEPSIYASINENNELIFMVITVRGVYFIKLNYLNYLKDYYSKKSTDELRIVRNTIFARKGRAFNSEDLQEYFSNQSWYKVNSNYSDSLLTDFDISCINFIKGIEEEKLK